METQYGGRTANQLRDLLAGAESAQASIEAMLGGGVNAITVFRDLLTAAEGRDAQAGSAQAQLIASQHRLDTCSISRAGAEASE